MKTAIIIIVCIIIISVVAVAVNWYIKNWNENNYKSLVRYHNDLPDVYSSNIDLPIFYINMDKHKERRDFLNRQLVGVKNVVRVPGVLMNDEIFSTYTTNLSKSELGCFLAHINAIKEFLKTNFEKVVIVEDDACFKLSKFWDKRLSELEDKIFFVGFGGSAYIITRKLAKFIIDKFNESNNNIRFPIDIWYQRLFHKDKNINRKDLIYQYNISLPSTISNNPYRCINEAVKIIRKWKK